MSERDRPEPGWLLVATPRLTDPNFQRTVVYVITTDDEGTVGVVLNKPSDTAVHTVLPRWGEYTAKPRALYVGGPVQTDSAMAIGVLRSDAEPPHDAGLAAVTRRVVLVNLETDPQAMMPLLKGVRVYAGHAGWGRDQLAGEIDEGAWHVLPGLADDVLAGPREDLWFRVMRRQPLPYALEAYHPGNVHRN